MFKLNDVREGSIVFVYNRDRRGPVEARVDEVEADIKHGLPGIGYTILEDGEGYWAYLDQVKHIVKY